MSGRHTAVAGVVGLSAAIAVAGCGSRPSVWNADPNVTAIGLSYGVALVDDTNHQVAVLTATSATPPDLKRPVSFIPIGHNIVTPVASADGSTLFVLAKGEDHPTTDAEQPSLTTIQIDSSLNVTSTSYPMSAPTIPATPCQSLAVDPGGQYAVAYQPEGFLSNPNELVIFNLKNTNPELPNVVVKNLQSFGGTPQQFTFTPQLLVDPALGLPDGQRRLLIVETQIDLSLLDLDHAFDPSPRPEYTIPLTSGTTGEVITPAGVAVDSSNPTSASDAQFALRANTQDVFTFTFGPPDPTNSNDFKPIFNETPVGGTPTDMAFVQDEQGNVDLAVLVPSTSSAVLVQPSTSATSTVTLPFAYQRMSLVTQAVTNAPGPDVALLWSGGAASGVALWTVGQPYYSIDVPGVSGSIQTVLDVPNSSYKVLQPSDDSGFFVLNLASSPPRVAPLITSTQATLSISPDGHRVWAFTPGGTDVGCTPLNNIFNASNVTTSATISSVYDIGSAGDGRALVVLDNEGTIGATLFDALNPTMARRIPALLLEAP